MTPDETHDLITERNNWRDRALEAQADLNRVRDDLLKARSEYEKVSDGLNDAVNEVNTWQDAYEKVRDELDTWRESWGQLHDDRAMLWNNIRWWKDRVNRLEREHAGAIRQAREEVREDRDYWHAQAQGWQDQVERLQAELRATTQRAEKYEQLADRFVTERNRWIWMRERADTGQGMADMAAERDELCDEFSEARSPGERHG